LADSSAASAVQVVRTFKTNYRLLITGGILKNTDMPVWSMHELATKLL
jgi:hypothetical protein